jgi:hypothetical protein
MREITQGSLARPRLFVTSSSEFSLAESSDQQGVSIGTVKTKHVDGGFALGRIDYLPDPQ